MEQALFRISVTIMEIWVRINKPVIDYCQCYILITFFNSSMNVSIMRKHKGVRTFIKLVPVGL